MELLLVGIVCFVTGAVIDVLVFRRQLKEAKEEWKEIAATTKTEAIEAKEKACQEQLAAMEKSCNERLTAMEKACQERIDAQELRHKEAIEAQQTRFNDTLEKMTLQVKSATEDMLKQRQKEFAETSNTNLGQIVNPLKETIDKMKQAMTDNTLKQTEMSSELKANIENMMRQSEAAKMSADELTRVFKHGSKIQGDWGESVLNELLTAQGLTEGIHYDVQPYIRDAQGNIITSGEGTMMRPDIILHLDKRREVIIDSKVSMTAFMDYVNADNEDERERMLKAHLDSINKHVKELSVKDYSSYIKPPKVRMDYVIMFVPHTGALWTALKAQPDLWRKAMDKNVFIADEQTLFAALRIITLTWTKIAQVQNHEKVYELANEMIDRVGQFMKRYEALGTALRNASNAYEDSKKKLQPNGQSILQTCAKLTKLGAKQSEKNPLPQILDIDDIPMLDEPASEITTDKPEEN